MFAPSALQATQPMPAHVVAAPVLSQVLTPDLGPGDKTLIWTLLVGESLLWFGLVAVLFSSRPVLEWLRARMIWFDRAVGIVLIGLATKVALSSTR